MITRSRSSPKSHLKKNESLQKIESKPSYIDDYLDVLMKQLAIEMIQPIKQSCDEMRLKIPISYDDIPSMEKPKAIFIAGAPGSGKTYLMTHLIPNNFKYALYNVDLYQEHLLKTNGLFENKEREKTIRNELQAEHTNITPKELDKLTQSHIASIIATSMAISQKCMREDFNQMLIKKLPIVIDRPGNRASTVREDKKKLEKAGYQTIMIMVYVSPITALQRNQLRERHVHPPRILDAWIGCMNNIATYKTLFGENFFLIQNDSSPFEITAKELESYIPPSQVPDYLKKIKKILKKSLSFTSIDNVYLSVQSFLAIQNGGHRHKRQKIKK